MVTVKGKLNVVHSPALMSVLLNGSSCRMEHIFTDVCERWIGCLEEEPIPGAVDFTLAFSVTEKNLGIFTAAELFQNTLSGSFGYANWLHVHKSYNPRHVFLKFEC